MKTRLLLIAIAGAGLFAAAGPVFADNSLSAEFDANQPIKVGDFEGYAGRFLHKS